jgi:hypothetical protein
MTVIATLSLYFISLFSYLMYCRQKRLGLEAQQRRIQVSEAAAPLPDNDRQGPLSSVVRVQSLAEDHMIENCELVFTLDGFLFHSNETYQSTGATVVEGPRELSSEAHSLCERCGYGRELGVQFQRNGFEQDENIGQGR